jgi:hypothetical protein
MKRSFQSGAQKKKEKREKMEKAASSSQKLDLFLTKSTDTEEILIVVT